ncbi:MAG: hypothetical protein AMJ95_06790 [Omnitrophica WOR_2 bacterium SM23_72]|nr:MAG: hypothetical protein AMJ95_06790 [Omnitrophica WOR_2 bacterium SM23_72]
MRLINKNIYYAVRSLVYIAQKQDEMTSVAELVSKLKMRRAFLRRILQVLSKRGILKSLKGKGGGFLLNTQPSKLRIIDVIRIFRGKIDIMNCLLEKDVCPHPDECVLMAKMKDIERKLYRTLKTTTIATLLKSRPRRQ